MLHPPSYIRPGAVVLLHAVPGGEPIKPCIVTSLPFHACGTWLCTVTGCNAWVAVSSLSPLVVA